MRFTHRLTFSLVVALMAVSLVFATYQAGEQIQALKDDVASHSLELAQSQQKTVVTLLNRGAQADLQTLVEGFRNNERLAGVAVFDADGKPVAVTPELAPRLPVPPAAVLDALREKRAQGQIFRLGVEPMHVFAFPLQSGGKVIGELAIFHNVSYIGARKLAVWRRTLEGEALRGLVIICVTLLIVRWSLSKPLRRMAAWLHDLRTGSATAGGDPPKEEILRPIASEVKRLATDLHAARSAAQEEAKLREIAQSIWTPERLRISVLQKLQGSHLFAVSNREPYEHVRRGNSIVWSVPASGLVTALEPVLRACNGTWIAQGTGEADREATGASGRLRVPPDHPEYTLRRVFLSKEQADGFYFGFANEGLWPLCHIAHTRPVFRAQDWEAYGDVNRKFADALLREMEGEHNPLVLLQDYHFALLPRMVKEKRPDARIALFWHIPWPNAEAFGICPWQNELLEGMLGADLIGFHIQAHCNNFLETVDRALESRVDWEHFAVNRQDHSTAVRPFPISVAFNGNGAVPASVLGDERTELFRGLGAPETQYLGLGVDRVDYTKGIPERFRGIERLLERRPIYRGRLTFVQIGAPSRTGIKRYQELMTEVEQEAERINQRFGAGNWKPIVFLEKHHSHEEIQPYYRAADFCLVTSLHDGMNLVAKEYIAARGDEQGALILSRFTGASHELVDALVINPYDADEMAGAIDRALVMPAEETKARMQRLRAQVREYNVYRWAGSLISELAGIRLEADMGPAVPLSRERNGTTHPVYTEAVVK